MVVVQVFDLSGWIPLGTRKVHPQILQKAEELAQARGSLQVQGQVRVALRDLDLAQVEESDSVWVQEQERAEAQVEVQVQELVEVEGRESALPKGYRLDSEQGLVRDLVQVTELELG